MNTVRVGLGERSYDIVIGGGLLARAASLLVPLIPAKRVIIVTDQNVGLQYASVLAHALSAAEIHSDVVTIKPGEASKSFASYGKLMDALLALKPDRKTTILALGGGVIGDLAGFAASTLLRGVPFIQVPTSLLAQVDSSVGGKTAINSVHGKNLVGSFYQPKLVLADIDTLMSLPPRQLRAGYAEILKYGLIMNPEFYQWCLANGSKLIAGDAAARAYAIEQACRMKAQVVQQDEQESGVRAHLNFGHTFGHALEAETGYSDTLLHGEAVAIGMVMACRLSQQLQLIPDTVEHTLAAHLKSVGLPSSVRDVKHSFTVDAVMRHCFSDKKAESGTLTFIVLDAVGSARVQKRVDAELARVIVASFLKA